MKTNITLRIDEKARKFIWDNDLNASSLFETFIFKELMKTDFYIELSQYGNKVYERIVKIQNQSKVISRSEENYNNKKFN